MGYLRYLLAAAVVMAHSQYNSLWLPAGNVAVESFFMISGFYMALILNTRYTTSLPFYLNRFLRLMPLYWLLFIITVLVNHSFLKGVFRLPVADQLLILTTNVTVLGQDLLFYLTPDLTFTSHPIAEAPARLYRYIAIPPSWTLSLEITFYLIAPYIVRNLWRIVVLALASLTLRIILVHHGFVQDPFNYRLFPQELLFFCLGAFSWYLLQALRQHYPTQLATYAWPFTGALIACVCIFSLIPLPYASQLTAWYTLLMLGLPFIFQATSRNTFSNNLGEISYPLYLCHIMVLSRVSKLIPTFAVSHPALTSLLGLTAATLVAIILHKVIESQIAPFRNKLRPLLHTQSNN